MAIARCTEHPPKGRTRNYVGSVEPFGYPETAIICGSRHCSNPGLIWLEAHEKRNYDSGQRIMESFVSSAMKFRVQ